MLKAIFAQLEGKTREEQNAIVEKLPKIQKELLDRYNEYQFDQQQQHMEKEKKRLGFCSDKEVYTKVGPRSYDYSSPNLDKCTQISLWDDELGDEGAEALAQAIKGHANFVGLSLDTTGIEVAGAVALAAAVEGSDVFQSLDLDGNSVGNAGAIALAKALESCKAMQVLNLAHNDVGNEGAEALVALVKKHRGIVQLGQCQRAATQRRERGPFLLSPLASPHVRPHASHGGSVRAEKQTRSNAPPRLTPNTLNGYRVVVPYS